MKVKHLFLAAVAAVFTFAACQEKVEDLGEPNIDLSKTALEFDQGANSQTITLNSTRAWKATDVADWVVVEPASGKASKDDQTVTIAVLENTGINRTCSIKFTCGIDSEYLTVSQKGPGGGPEEGDGTKEHPYSASQANRVGSELGADEKLENIYVSGIVSYIKSIDTGSYGNAEYYISDDGSTDDQFYVYRGYSLGGNKFKSEDELKVGDVVVVCGTLVNYNATTVEMTSGSKIVVLNGEEGGGDDPVGPVDPISGDNLLANGSFEDWTGEKPAAWDFASGNATLTKVSDAKEGSNACEIAGVADANRRLMSKSYVLLPGTYQIQAYIKGEGQYRVGYAKLTNGAIADTQNDYIYIDTDPVQATSEWTLHIVQFKLDANTEVSVNFMNNKKGAGKSIIVDDVKLVTEDGGLGEYPEPGPGPDAFESSLENPATASAALAYAQTLSASDKVEAYVKGKISQIDDVSTDYGNATYWISDDGTEANAFEIYRGYYLGGEKFTAEDQIKVGDEVIVFGNIVNYNGSVPEMTTGSKIISINGQGGEDGGEDVDDEIITGDNLLANGSFEEWSGEKPTAWAFTSGNATLTKSSDAKDGSNSCEVAGDAKANKRLMSKEYTLAPGTYQIQAYIKGEGQYRVGYAKLTDGAIADTQNDYIYIDTDPVQATSDWTLHVVQFKLDAQTSISVNFMNNKKGNGNSILVDDVKLVTKDGSLISSGDDGGEGGGAADEFNTSLDNPATASAALAYAQTLADGVQVEAYVKGKISKVKSVDTGQYGNAEYYISDDGSAENEFYIYRGYYLAGAKFTSSDQIKAGDEVIVFGKIVNYKGTTPEMTSGSKIMSINGQTSVDEGGNDGGDEGGDDGSNPNAVTWVVDNSTKSYEVDITANNTAYKGFKLGTSSAAGTATLNIPEGATSIRFCCVGWNGKTSVAEIVDSGNNVIATINPASNPGAKENSPFTMTVNESDYYTVALSGQTSLTVRSTDSAPRSIFFDFTAEK